jgi:hypothetical protein
MIILSTVSPLYLMIGIIRRAICRRSSMSRGGSYDRIFCSILEALGRDECRTPAAVTAIAREEICIFRSGVMITGNGEP